MKKIWIIEMAVVLLFVGIVVGVFVYYQNTQVDKYTYYRDDNGLYRTVRNVYSIDKTPACYSSYDYEIPIEEIWVLPCDVK